MSTAAPSASLRNLFSELEQLFQTETEARVSTSVQAAERSLAEHLNQSVRRLRQADGFAAIAAILCDASARFADACAVFQVNEHLVRGQRQRGAPGDAAADFQQLQFALSEAAAFAALVGSDEPVVALSSPTEISPALVALFQHSPADKVHLLPLTVDGATIGVVYAVGSVESAALELLTQTANAVLETRLRPARRPVPSASPDLVRIEPAAQTPSNPATDWEALGAADRAVHLRAQRFARVQVAEMRLYQPEAVKAGRARGDLYATLQGAIDSARAAYRQNFMSRSSNMIDYLHVELIRTLANDNPAWLGEKYPGPLA